LVPGLQKEKLEELASAEGVDLLYDYCIREKKTYAEVLTDFPSVNVPFAILLQLIPRQQPRSYSISSSALLHPGRVSFPWLPSLLDSYSPFTSGLRFAGASDGGHRRLPDPVQAPSPRHLLVILPVTGSVEGAKARPHVDQEGAL
jgi:hypothetical protein